MDECIAVANKGEKEEKPTISVLAAGYDNNAGKSDKTAESR